MAAASEPLIPKHGGYRKLKSFQVAQLVFDVTVRFCDLYLEKRRRTHDQMVQAARSNAQNIAEGSQASGTSERLYRVRKRAATALGRKSRLTIFLFCSNLREHRSEARWPDAFGVQVPPRCFDI